MTDASKTMIGKPKIGGAIFKAPAGTTLPITATEALATAFVEQGHVSEDGVERAINKSFASLKAWGGEEVATAKTEETVRVTFSLIEVNNEVTLKAKFGDDAVTVDAETGRITLDYKGDETDAAVWVIDLEFNGMLRRIVFGNAQDVTEDFTQTFTDEELIALPFELAVKKDVDGRYFRDIIEAAA